MTIVAVGALKAAPPRPAPRPPAGAAPRPAFPCCSVSVE